MKKFSMGNNFAKDFKDAHPEEIGANGVIKVCIGGGAGFIGSHIAKRLMAEVGEGTTDEIQLLLVPAILIHDITTAIRNTT